MQTPSPPDKNFFQNIVGRAQTVLQATGYTSPMHHARLPQTSSSLKTHPQSSRDNLPLTYRLVNIHRIRRRSISRIRLPALSLIRRLKHARTVIILLSP